MEQPATILVVDDTPANVRLAEARLVSQGYNVQSAASGEEALELIERAPPDLVLLDIVMPGLSGYEVCQRLRADPTTAALPIVMMTASGQQEKIKSLEAGADDFVLKPFDPAELLARVRSLLRIKRYHDTIEAQAAELTEWNRSLEARVQEQVAELERHARLKRFLPPQVAEALITEGAERVLESHRRDIAVLYCDLRGFTAFSETAEPEEVMAMLHEYHAALGNLINEHEGTLEHFAGDGLMVFFNDPIPCDDPDGRAVRLAVKMRERFDELAVGWRQHGHELGFGVGIARGYATMGQIGYEGRHEYGAIGTVANLAARLCGEAAAGQILIPARVNTAVEASAHTELVGNLTLKGFLRPVTAFNVVDLR